MFFVRLTVVSVFAFVALTGCGIIRERQTPADSNMDVAREAIQNPLSPEETEEMLGDVASNWFYGQGIGETILTAGTVILFPPYAIYVAGNAALSMSGYEEVRVSEALPDSGEDIWNSVYDGVTSVPGRVTSTVAGEEYVTKRDAGNVLDRYVKRNKAPDETQESIKAWR